MSFDIKSYLRNQDKTITIYLDFYKQIEHKLYTFMLSLCTEAFSLSNTMMSLSLSDLHMNNEL